MIDRVTNAIAGGAVVSPWWLPNLSTMSDFAALLLPILGCTWLIVQIVLKITDRK